MLTVVATLHVIVAVVLILLVLVQDSKGGAMGGMFTGGTSNSILGATGAANLFVKATRVCAVIFALTCIALVTLTAKNSVMEGVVLPPAPVEQQQDPTTPPAAAPEQAPQAPVQKK